LTVLFEISKQVLENFKIQRSPNSGVQRSGDAQGDCLTKCPPYQILVLTSGVW